MTLRRSTGKQMGRVPRGKLGSFTLDALMLGEPERSGKITGAPERREPAGKLPKDDELIALVQAGKFFTVEGVLLDHPELVTASVGTATLLHFAAVAGQVRMATLLVENGAGVNRQCAFGNGTPLVWATDTCCPEMVSLLLEHGADVDAVDGTGVTALAWAAVRGYPEVADILIKNGADRSKADDYGDTPLHRAAASGCQEVAGMLMREGFDVPNGSGRTPLHLAAARGNADVIFLLVINGAEVNAADEDERTPVELSRANEHPGASALLRMHGGVPYDFRKDEYGRTPLALAAAGGDLTKVRRLLERHASVCCADIGGWMPIHRAAQHGHVEVLKALLAKDATAGDETHEGWDALDIAVMEGHEDAAAVIREAWGWEGMMEPEQDDLAAFREAVAGLTDDSCAREFVEAIQSMGSVLEKLAERVEHLERDNRRLRRKER